MYRGYYAELRHCGVTGVKVDGQALIEALAHDVSMTYAIAVAVIWSNVLMPLPSRPGDMSLLPHMWMP